DEQSGGGNAGEAGAMAAARWALLERGAALLSVHPLRLLERFPFRRTISRICEVCSAFRSRDLIKTRGDRLAEAPDGERGILQSICGNFAQERLEFGESLFDGIEVGTVCREVKRNCSAR